MRLPKVMPRIRVALDRAANTASKASYPILTHAIKDWRDVRVVRDVPYLGTARRSHTLDIYRSANANGALPTVLYIHGGAFSMMSKDTHRVMAYMLAARGYQVFNINYRLCPEHRFPEPLIDAIDATKWIVDHGANYGADLSRFCIMGESAGANLTTAVAVCATQPRPEPFARELFERNIALRCVAPLYGVLDLNDIRRFWRDPTKDKRMAVWIKREIKATALAYLGDLNNASEAKLASPLQLLEKPPSKSCRPLPPFFTTVGTADPLLSDTLRLRDALEMRGTECDLHVYRGEIHAFNVFLWRAAAKETGTHFRAFYVGISNPKNSSRNERHATPTVSYRSRS
ncbi:MAG: alpha/beta hydrolase fold domain-containing protein [Polyangiales bacterium]